MIKNYLIIAFRNFFRNGNYTLINISGLSIGITSCIVVFLLITYDLRFDKFHSKYDRIYRIVEETKSSSGVSYGSVTPYPLAKAFRNDFAEIPLVTQMHFQGEVLLKIGDEKRKVEDVLFADSLFFDVFDFKILSGNPNVELGEPGKVFLTKSLADKILKGHENATIRLDNILELQVAGIIADPPPTSHINFSMIVSMPSLTVDFVGGFPLDQWSLTASGFTYIVLPEKVLPQAIESRFKAFSSKYDSKEDAERKLYRLQPLRNVHFDSQYTKNPGDRSNAEISDLVVMGILGGFILIIACINFINLATALAVKKSKEIGIRKTLGAKRGHLTAYFLGETFLLTFFSVILSLGATEWLLPWLNNFSEKNIDLNLFSNSLLILFLVLLILFATLLSGFYPSVILSRYNPVDVLKNKIGASGTSGAPVRKVLVVFQFIIAQVLIVGTLIVADQMQYLKNKPLGFDKEAIINVPIPNIKTENLESLRARLNSNAQVQSLSFSLGPPTSENSFSTNYFLSEKGSAQELYTIGVKPVDRQYRETYGIRLKAGRWFTETDEKYSDLDLPKEEERHVYIINESAARRLGFNDPSEALGKLITTGVYGINAEIVGVVEDFHIASLHDTIEPLVLMNLSKFYYDVGIKVHTENISQTIKFIEKQWTEVFPDYNFEYSFLDQELDKLYRQDERTYTLFKIFATISIFIGCLGLYGLISFMAYQKVKEVGIRKVMGASVSNIVALFSKEFVKLIIIAFILSAPVSWYLMHRWLQTFAYKINISWTIFLAGFLTTIIIVLSTIAYRAIRAARINPAITLRRE